MGGIIGLLLVLLLIVLANSFADAGINLTLKNISLAMAISVVIGLFSGIVPAWLASRLNPVEAIRSK